jgi:histidinol-phosphate aminotransferase
LRRHETLRVTRETLTRLAARRPLGVVTGRPRTDALRFLEEHEIAGLFSTVVCMEDAPAKPDPAPVRLALERIGASTAWMVGDTPDDLRAARGAGVLPIAIPAVGDDPAAAATTLVEEGAAWVLDELNDLEEMVP